jgi:hypothetical protein
MIGNINMIKNIFIVVILFLTQSSEKSYAQSDEATKLKFLLNAYDNKSLTMLKQFYTQWQSEIKPISKKERSKLSDTLQKVYQVFEFYSNLNEKPNRYNRSLYCMVQNQIEFSITNVDHITFPLPDSLLIKKDTLIDFRPIHKKLQSKIVYLSPLYLSVLKSFVNQDTLQINDVEKKMYDKVDFPGWPHANFLANITEIRASTMGFLFTTFPDLDIEFNKNMDEAIVNSSIGFSFWGELLVKQSGIWKCKEILYDITL